MSNLLINDLKVEMLKESIKKVMQSEEFDANNLILTDISIVANSDLLLVRFSDELMQKIFEVVVIYIDNINLKNKYIVNTVTRLR